MAGTRGRLILPASMVVLIILVVVGAGTLSAATPQGGTAEITSPAANAELRGVVAVRGTAMHSGFQFFKVEFGVGTAPDHFSVLGELRREQVFSGELAVWDTTQVPDGQYTLRLTVIDNTGNFIQASRVVNVANETPPAAAAPPRRGCLSCHVLVAPDGRYTLAYEGQVRAEARGGSHPTVSPTGVSLLATDQTGVTPCLECHSPGTGARAGMGALAPLSLRDIVHPAHMSSNVFVGNYGGNCFTCHNVSGTGEWEVLSDAVEVNEKGVPRTVPIPGALPPS